MAKSATTVLLLSFALTAAAFAATPPTTPPDPSAVQPVFCNQTYALCIKAPCSPIVTRNSDGSYSIKEANCSCVVLPGWSMGQADCASRAPQIINGRTYLVSTYSNAFNTSNQTLTCLKTTWAWCYGKPCVVDEKNPNLATCTCPVFTSPASTLGGACNQDACKSIFSAALPKADTWANTTFYNYGISHGFNPPPNPVATDCSK